MLIFLNFLHFYQVDYHKLLKLEIIFVKEFVDKKGIV